MLQTSLSRREAWISLFAAAVFLPALLSGFVYDDTQLINHNVFVQAPEYWMRAFTTHFWDTSRAAPASELLRLYRPLVTLSYLANWCLGFGQAWTFHLVNVLLHALNAGLVFVIAQRLTKSGPLGTLSALCFVLHPTRSETVIWASGRPDLLMTTFVLLTVQCVHWGKQRKSRPLALAGVVLSFSAALLSKEPALAIPLLLLADGANEPRSERIWCRSMAAVTAALGAGYLVLRSWLLPVGSPAVEWTPARALVTLSHYAERAVWPWPLTFFYKPEELGRTGWSASPWELGLGLGLAVGLVVWGAITWRRDRVAFWLVAAGLAFLGPLLNVTQTGSRILTSDRFLYLPLLLLFVAACRSGARTFVLHKWPTSRLALVGVGAIYVVANGTRALDFFNERTLWQSELSIHPDNPVALRGLAAQAVQAGNTQGALAYLEHSLQARALRFRRVASLSENVDTYGTLLGLKGSTLPDGSVPALRMLVQEGVDRLAGKARPSRSQLMPIDWPPDEQTARWVALQGEEAIARHLVTISTRLDVHDVSVTLLDAVSNELLHLAPNPMLIALAEARERRFDRALDRVASMRARRKLMPSVVTDVALAECEARIISAQEFFTAASTLSQEETHLTRARGLATLGAYFRALLDVQQVDSRHPGMLPFYVQLLVSARLEREALQVASQALGFGRAGATVEAIRAQLPPELRALAPAEPTPGVSRSGAL